MTANIKKNKIMKKLLFGIVATAIFSVSSFANTEINPKTENQKPVVTYTVEGKTYSQVEFNKLEDVQECTITVTRVVNGQTFSHTETFQASWWGCLLAHVGAFLASVIE